MSSSISLGSGLQSGVSLNSILLREVILDTSHTLGLSISTHHDRGAG
ncbi:MULTISPECIES: hypothetical protein [unclassified Corynebacterium]|nr:MULTISPECIES: hypothetical protein [unclassified Corynebacterium]